LCLEEGVKHKEQIVSLRHKVSLVHQSYQGKIT